MISASPPPGVRLGRTDHAAALTAFAGFAVLYFAHALLREAGVFRLAMMANEDAQEWTRRGVQVLGCITVVMLFRRTGARAALRELGLAAPVGPAFLAAAVAVMPALLGFAMTASLSDASAPGRLSAVAVAAPFGRRGALSRVPVRQLYRRAGGTDVVACRRP